MNLKLIPFTELEKKKNYTFTAFRELDVKMIMLNEVTNLNSNLMTRNFRVFMKYVKNIILKVMNLDYTKF